MPNFTVYLAESIFKTQSRKKREVRMIIGIIEDDNLLRKALDTSLQNQGYTTILAGSRKEARSEERR